MLDKCVHKSRLMLYINIKKEGGKGDIRELTKDGNAGRAGIKRRAWCTKRRTGKKEQKKKRENEGNHVFIRTKIRQHKRM